MHGRQGLLHNLSILTAGQVVSQLANVAALVYLANTLGDRSFGVVQIGVAFMGYAVIIAEWGMFSLGIREVSRLDDPAAIGTYARRHMGLMSIQAVVVFGLGLLILPLLPFSHHDPLVFILYLAAVLPQVYTQSWVAVGLERMKWVGLARIVRSLSYAAMVFLLLRLLDGFLGQDGRRWVPVLMLLSVIFGNLVVNIPLARWFGGWIHPTAPTVVELKRRWHETTSIGANTMVVRVLYNIDLILLGSLASPEVAGHYAAAAKIMFVLVIAVEVLWAALLPRLSRLAKQSRPAFRTSFNLTFGTVAALLLPIAVGGWMVGEGVIELLYRGKFAGAGPIFQVLAVSYACLALGTFLGNTLLAEDRQKWYFSPLVISSLVAIGGIWWLVPQYGGQGAAWGILMAHGLLLACLVVVNLRNFNALLGQTLLGVLPALGAMYLVLRALPEAHVLLRIPVAAVVYLALAFYPLLRLRRRSQALTPVVS